MFNNFSKIIFIIKIVFIMHDLRKILDRKLQYQKSEWEML